MIYRININPMLHKNDTTVNISHAMNRPVDDYA